MIEKVRELFAKYEVQLSVDEPKAEAEASAEAPAEAPVEVKLAAAMLDNGQEIQTSAEAFAEGADVFVVNEAGEQVPLPDGNYTLEGGATFEVAEGVITSMMEAPAEEVEQKSEEVETNLSASLSKEEVASMIKEAVTELASHVDKLLESKDEELQKLSSQAAGKINRLEAPAKKTFSQAELAAMPLNQRIAAMMKNN
jgi:hypothetical protein